MIAPKITNILSQCQQDLELILKQPVIVHYSVKVNYITGHQIVFEICRLFERTWSEIISESREQENKVPRQLFCWLAHHYLKWDHSLIAGHVNRDRSTVTKSIKHVSEMINNNDLLYIGPLQITERKLFANEKSKH